MSEQQKHKSVDKTIEETEKKDVQEIIEHAPKTLAHLVGHHLPKVMVDRKAMTHFEHEITEWVNRVPDHSPEEKKRVLDQLTNAKLAMESIYIRVSQSY